jgi:hypothetical protein
VQGAGRSDLCAHRAAPCLSQSGISPRRKLGMQIYDFILAGCMWVISGIMFWQMRDFSASDSKALPTAIAVLLIVLGLALVIARLRKKNTKDTYQFKNSSKGFMILLLLLVFALCANWFGFYVSMPFFLLAGMLVLGQRRKWALILVPILTTAVALFFFYFLFQIPLPEGTIFNIFNLLS